MKIKNITVEIMAGQYVISWNDYQSNRYHVWLTLNAERKDGGVVYKNPPLGTSYRDVKNGWFDTRHLNINAKANRPTFDYAMAHAVENKLFEAAHAAQDEKEAEEKRQRDERYKLHLKQTAAVQMFNTLEVIEAEFELGNITLSVDVVKALQQTLRIARGENN